jgi:hypothetical protein
MNTAEYLGPFSRLPQYRDPPPYRQEALTPARKLGKVCTFDFDVRPQRTCLINGRHLRLADEQVNWDQILTRSILSVARTLGLVGDQYVERGVEGECDDGTVTCWVRVKRPSRQMLAVATQKLYARLAKQNWPLHHPDRNPDRSPRLLSEGPLQPTPGRDRISIQILDTKSKSNYTIPMLAENFYFVTQEVDRLVSYPLIEWDRLLAQLKPG